MVGTRLEDTDWEIHWGDTFIMDKRRYVSSRRTFQMVPSATGEMGAAVRPVQGCKLDER